MTAQEEKLVSYHIAGVTINTLESDGEWFENHFKTTRLHYRIAVYECTCCKNLQYYEHDASELTIDNLFDSLTEDEQCWGCNNEPKGVKLISIYEV